MASEPSDPRPVPVLRREAGSRAFAYAVMQGLQHDNPSLSDELRSVLQRRAEALRKDVQARVAEGRPDLLAFFADAFPGVPEEEREQLMAAFTGFDGRPGRQMFEFPLSAVEASTDIIDTVDVMRVVLLRVGVGARDPEAVGEAVEQELLQDVWLHDDATVLPLTVPLEEAATAYTKARGSGRTVMAALGDAKVAKHLGADMRWWWFRIVPSPAAHTMRDVVISVGEAVRRLEAVSESTDDPAKLPETRRAAQRRFQGVRAEHWEHRSRFETAAHRAAVLGVAAAVFQVLATSPGMPDDRKGPLADAVRELRAATDAAVATELVDAGVQVVEDQLADVPQESEDMRGKDVKAISEADRTVLVEVIAPALRAVGPVAEGGPDLPYPVPSLACPHDELAASDAAAYVAGQLEPFLLQDDVAGARAEGVVARLREFLTEGGLDFTKEIPELLRPNGLLMSAFGAHTSGSVGGSVNPQVVARYQAAGEEPRKWWDGVAGVGWRVNTHRVPEISKASAPGAQAALGILALERPPAHVQAPPSGAAREVPGTAGVEIAKKATPGPY